MSTDSELAHFVDRQTLRYLRFYPVAVEEVWRAVTVSEHLNVWLLPVSYVEPRAGGRCRFSWGAPDDPAQDGEVSIFEPMRRVRYETPAGHLEFLLSPVEGGTELAFTQYFHPDFVHPPEAFAASDPGAVDPIGGTPWRTGFIAGFHVYLDDLAIHLEGAMGDAELAAASEARVATANIAGFESEFLSDPDSAWSRLLDRYLEHVRASYPVD